MVARRQGYHWKHFEKTLSRMPSQENSQKHRQTFVYKMITMGWLLKGKMRQSERITLGWKPCSLPSR